MKIVRHLWLLLLLGFACCAFGASDHGGSQLRQQIEATLHIPDPLPEVRGKSYGQFTAAPGVAADRVSYATGYGLRVPAIVYHQAGATIERHPALIVVQGRGSDKSSWQDYWAGILYARAGALVLTYDPIGEYERNKNRRSNQRDRNIPSGNLRRRLAGLMVTDAIQAVSYLAQRPDVDPKRIAVLGSASFAASLACAVNTHIRACVLAGGGDTDHPKFLADLRKQAIDELGNSKNVFDCTGRQPCFLTKSAALWLEKRLKFRNWTRKQLEAMPETNENGTMALSGNIPALPRDELYAVPLVVWQSQKENYTYESWVVRAKAAIARERAASAKAH